MCTPHHLLAIRGGQSLSFFRSVLARNEGHS